MLTFLNRNYFSKIIKHSKFCIIGGGSGGLNFVAQMKRESVIQPQDLTVFESSTLHYYQPGWTLVTGGLMDIGDTIKNVDDIIPKGVNLVHDKVVKVIPEENKLITFKGEEYTYNQLIISAGNYHDWNQIKGARECLEDPSFPAGSAYTRKYSVKQNKINMSFKGGRFIFTEPDLPIKCSGAPQKVLFLANDMFIRNGIRSTTNVEFYCAKDKTYNVEKYNKSLEKIHKEIGTNLYQNHKLVEIKKESKTAVFLIKGDKPEYKEVKFDAIHIVPPQKPPTFIKVSGLGDENGYVDINIQTMQHKKYKNIWSIGDSCNAPNAKTAAAVFSQTPVLVKNILQVLKGQQNVTNLYDGYSSCPIPVGGNKLLLCEYKYNHEVSESFPFDQGVPSSFFYYLKLKIFPYVYWNLVPKGYWYGRNAISPLIRKLFN